MPLKRSASKKAFSENVATEMRAGRPQRQALAIAYDVKKKAAVKGRPATKTTRMPKRKTR